MGSHEVPGLDRDMYIPPPAREIPVVARIEQNFYGHPGQCGVLTTGGARLVTSAENIERIRKGLEDPDDETVAAVVEERFLKERRASKPVDECSFADEAPRPLSVKDTAEYIIGITEFY